MTNPQDTPTKPPAEDEKLSAATETESVLPADEEAEEKVSKDKLFKTVIRTFFKDFIELLDAELAATLDLDDPDFLPPEVFSDFQKQGHMIPDLVARIATREGEERLVLFHVDVEANFSNAMDQRVRLYSMHLELTFKLPVISAVLFLKGGPSGVELRLVEREIGGRVFGTFLYFAFGLSQSLAEDYVDLPQTVAPALAALMRSRIWDKSEQKLQCRKAIRRRELPLAEAYVLDRIVDTQLELNPAQEKRYRELERQEGQEVQEMVITWEDALADRYTKGETKGRTEGEASGALKATRRAILLLARHRHSQLPDGFEEKLEAIDSLSRLYEILEQVPDVTSLEELDLTP